MKLVGDNVVMKLLYMDMLQHKGGQKYVEPFSLSLKLIISVFTVYLK